MNGCQGDGFSNVGAQTGAIKLTMAGIQDWWHRFPSLLGANSIWLEHAEFLITK